MEYNKLRTQARIRAEKKLSTVNFSNCQDKHITCVITTVSGFTVTGSAQIALGVLDPSSADMVAYNEAFDKLIDHELYLLLDSQTKEPQVRGIFEETSGQPKESIESKEKKESKETKEEPTLYDVLRSIFGEFEENEEEGDGGVIVLRGRFR